MRVLRAFGIGLITAVAGCVLAFFVGDYLTQLGHMSNMEGGRGMFVVFVCGPLGILAGFIIGVISSVIIHRRDAAGFFIAQGWSLLAVVVLAGLSSGIPYLLSDKPPRINGKELILEFELRVPSQFKIPDTPTGDTIRAILYSGNREGNYAFIDWSGIKRSPEGSSIPGQVALLTHNPARSLLATVGNDWTAAQFIDLKLPASPGPTDEQWSDWIVATKRANLDSVPNAERFSARYRVRTIGH
jgi:hypothetical protein